MVMAFEKADSSNFTTLPAMQRMQVNSGDDTPSPRAMVNSCLLPMFPVGNAKGCSSKGYLRLTGYVKITGPRQLAILAASNGQLGCIPCNRDERIYSWSNCFWREHKFSRQHRII
ncbi:hypothetical protein SCLCIDRAFT_483728 [Scleroderma citrinum Foug A]|uniref:Uncharacterized protein n=1 Tax=Scleroderma citrinum Foug A TaxID=1036808 RepID=A0A0C3D921_9AGAM|nr:hypothetical protein SCLCIDRAFT_483728 [Scleroderma citrinum Foug A]